MENFLTLPAQGPGPMQEEPKVSERESYNLFLPAASQHQALIWGLVFPPINQRAIGNFPFPKSNHGTVSFLSLVDSFY